MKYIIFKRLLDIVLAFILLLISLPLILFFAICTRLFFGKQIFFTQKRTGYKSKTFILIKFRTLPHDFDLKKDKKIQLKKNHWYFDFLRRSSLDELPQLLNILQGNMSFIGPRPLRYEYKEIYNKFQNKRHDVYPGITGWAQINGRNSISWDQKFIYDIWYVENISLLLDLFILIKTFFIFVFPFANRKYDNIPERFDK